MEQKQIDELLADKLALDQMYGDTIRALHECKKQLILKDDQIKKLMLQIDELLKKELCVKEPIEPSIEL
jgi:hypothetical protein